MAGNHASGPRSVPYSMNKADGADLILSFPLFYVLGKEGSIEVKLFISPFFEGTVFVYVSFVKPFPLINM